MGEGGFGVAFKDIAGQEHTLAGGRAERPFDFKIDYEGLLVVLELVDRGDFDLDPTRHEVFDV
jgi:hypothetical protein